MLPPHLIKLHAQSNKTLSDATQAELAGVLLDYHGVFATNDNDLGHFSEIKHRIPTTDAHPTRQLVRWTSLGFQDEEDGHLQKMLDAGIVQPSQSEWAASVVLVRKKDGGVRWCIDYICLNDITEKDAYPRQK